MDQDLEELKEMMEENLRYTKNLASDVKSLKHQMWWSRTWAWIKFLLVVVPLVWGYLFISEKVSSWQQDMAKQQSSYTQQIQQLLKVFNK